MSKIKQFIIVDGQVFISSAHVESGAFVGLGADEALASIGSVISESELARSAVAERKLTIDEMACMEIDFIRELYGRSRSSVEMWNEAYEVARHRAKLRDGPAPIPESVSGEGWRIDFKSGGFELFNTADGKIIDFIRARMSGDTVGVTKTVQMYDWSKAPEWAVYAVINRHGVALWLEGMPSAGLRDWWLEVGDRKERIWSFSSVKNWRETLEARPK